ncbi:MAG: phosphoenolpyruvate--protein phosphotransferase [Rhizobiaceae bacterium]|nr:phosphoenolpyruvate--protein phosphotransferase [Rhizobiaceae bacterium]
MNRPESGPRVLLKHLREVMAEALEAQEQLDKIVMHIAANMVADVCSVYVLRSDDNLELYASVGLNPDAVHEVSLKVGQGLVGTIAANARSLNLEDAQKHPAFAYLPETGEEVFNSFMGVPILRAGRALGVLVVQNKEGRIFGDVEIEALETTAMVIAELIAAGQLAGLGKQGSGLDLTRPLMLTGVPLAEGIGFGKVVLHEPRVVVTDLFNEDAQGEIERLGAALGKLRISIDGLLQRGEVTKDGEHREVLEAYRMFANDRGWIRRMEEAISNGLTAEASVEKVQSDNRARMARQSDPYLREHLHDLDDLANRLLRELMGKPHGPMDENITGDFVIVARNMGAAELLDYAGKNLRGLVLEEAAPTSHVVIVARALGIAVVGQLSDVISISESNDTIIVDGESGDVHIRPTEEVEVSYAEKVELLVRQQALYENMKNEPSLTKDGVAIDLLMNAGLLMDLPQLENVNAAGIGLFRTELQFMVAASFPRPGEQEELYRSVIKAANGKPVTFRTLDVGGDKVLPYLRSVHEENPALGWRAIRLSLDRPGLIRTQVKALLKAADGGSLKIMLPMVTEVREITRAKEIIDHEVELLKRFGHEMPTELKLGVMIEVPSLLWQLDELMAEVDFVSIGSNDLFQFIMASDRGNAKISNRFSPLSRPFLRALHQIALKADEHETEFSLCGEIAGQPLAAMALVALGYRAISMSPASLGPVKAMTLNLDKSKLEPLLLDALAKPSNDTPLLNCWRTLPILMEFRISVAFATLIRFFFAQFVRKPVPTFRIVL